MFQVWAGKRPWLARIFRNHQDEETVIMNPESRKVMEKLVCIPDFEEAAAKILDLNALEYYKSGADDEYTLKENKSAFAR